MAQKVWTAAELEQLSPAGQDAIFTAGIVRELADVPSEFLARGACASRRPHRRHRVAGSVTTERRAVRATARFFEDLDRQLSAERGPDGQPSTNDFQVFDLFRIVETFDPLVWPEDAEAAIDFLTSNEWPFHGSHDGVEATVEVGERVLDEILRGCVRPRRQTRDVDQRPIAVLVKVDERSHPDRFTRWRRVGCRLE